jgi:hypothetical protein
VKTISAVMAVSTAAGTGGATSAGSASLFKSAMPTALTATAGTS